MNDDTKAGIGFAGLVIGFIAAIVFAILVKLPPLVGDCGTDVQLNAAYSLFFTGVLKIFSLIIGAVVGFILAMLVIGVINLVTSVKEKVIEFISSIGETKTPVAKKRITFKAIAIFILDSLSSFNVCWFGSCS